MSLLNFGFIQEKKRDGVAEDLIKQGTNGPAAEDEIQIKNKKYDMQQKH